MLAANLWRGANTVTEREMIEQQTKAALAEGEAIIAKVKVIGTWVDRKNRPLHVHREIRRIAKETGEPVERRVALNYAKLEIIACIAEHSKIKMRIMQLEHERDLATD